MTEHPQLAPAGWYLTPDGRQRYWDGAEWTPNVVAARPATRSVDKSPGQGQHEVRRSTRTATAGVLLGVEAALAAFGVLIAYVFTAEYSDPTASTREALTSGFVVGPLLFVGAAGLVAVLASTRSWMRVTAVVVPVLMVVGMLVAIPAALAAKREAVQHPYGAALPSAGWQVVESDGQRP